MLVNDSGTANLHLEEAKFKAGTGKEVIPDLMSLALGEIDYMDPYDRKNPLESIE